ncbi:MAG: ABC transporter substrate-binding protein [Alphaproteobacteria bacterium]|nr:ABC transporter substrate-binding protein [Alphaproteobacteria bacterium]
MLWYKAIGLAAAAGVLAFSLAAAPAAAYERDGDRKILVWGGRTPVVNIDPHQRFDAPHHLVQAMLYEPLVKYVENPARLIPWIAESWEASADARVWTFRLNANARFQNGDPIDAEAVRYSFVRALEINKAVSWMLRDVLKPAGVSVVDPRTVRFTLEQPYPSFAGFLPWWMIVNPKQITPNIRDNDNGQAWMTDNAAGSGPFRIRRWEQNAFYHFEAIPNYWNGWPQGEARRLGGVIYRIIREPSAQRTALMSRQVDFVEGLTTADYVQLRNVPGITIQNSPGSTAFGIKFNYQRGPTADANLRRAIAHAFDYESFAGLYAGDSQLMTSPFPNTVQGHVAVQGMPRRNLDRARELLGRTQWANGGLELTYVHQQGNDETRRVGLILLNSLQALNIKVNIQPMLWANMVANAQRVETVPNMIGLFTVTFSSDPDSYAYQFHRNSWGQWFGVSHYNNPDVFTLIERARSIPRWEERAPIYADIQRRIAEDQPEVFGFQPNTRLAHRAYVRGYSYTPMRPSGFADFHALWIED